jgi:hypothetical protein
MDIDRLSLMRRKPRVIDAGTAGGGACGSRIAVVDSRFPAAAEPAGTHTH